MRTRLVNRLGQISVSFWSKVLLTSKASAVSTWQRLVQRKKRNWSRRLFYFISPPIFFTWERLDQIKEVGLEELEQLHVRRLRLALREIERFS